MRSVLPHVGGGRGRFMWWGLSWCEGERPMESNLLYVHGCTNPD